MTLEELAELWDWYGSIRRTTDQRKGQALMNALRRVAPILYDMVSGTDADCFYDDNRIGAFLDTMGIPRYAAPVKCP